MEAQRNTNGDAPMMRKRPVLLMPSLRQLMTWTRRTGILVDGVWQQQMYWTAAVATMVVVMTTVEPLRVKTGGLAVVEVVEVLVLRRRPHFVTQLSHREWTASQQSSLDRPNGMHLFECCSHEGTQRRSVTSWRVCPSSTCRTTGVM